jgi:preprotein translocase subunit SecD
MKVNKWILALIIVLIIASIGILIPSQIHLNINYKVPFINKTIAINQNLPGINFSIPGTKLQVKNNFSFRKGLDLEGGTGVTMRADMKGVPKDQRDNALNSAKSVIERRINFFGVTEPLVQTAKLNNDYRVIVELPGVTDVNQAVDLIGKTAKLTFWEEGASSSAQASPSALPLGVPQILGMSARQTDLTGSDLSQAAVTFDQNTSKPQVQLTFTPKGSEKFAKITERNIGKIVAIVLDNVVVEAPRVNEAITGGSAVITGNFTSEQAKQLQIQLNAGALPVSLSVLEQHGIGATLGNQTLHRSILAGIIGFIIIVIFMTVLYGRLGAIASLALFFYTIFVLALFKFVPITLTLAGIAGFILSIGIAVDANILIFERMKEEMRKGRTREQSIGLGFTRAWPSIRDSNIASLITSAILYYFGTGMVRGFALTLALGVIVSMFSAITVTRTLLRLFYKT